MFGWESLAAVRPSRLKRAPISVPPCWELRILTATGRSKTSSLPRKTTDMPPDPSSRFSANLPPRRLTGRLLRAQLLDYLPTHCARKGLQGPTQTLERLRRKRLFGIAQGLLRFMVRLD